MTDHTIKNSASKKRIREMQPRVKSEDRKQRTSRLVRCGLVVEALLKNGEMEAAEWVDACKRILKSERDISIATAGICSSLPNDAHMVKVEICPHGRQMIRIHKWPLESTNG